LRPRARPDVENIQRRAVLREERRNLALQCRILAARLTYGRCSIRHGLEQRGVVQAENLPPAFV